MRENPDYKAAKTGDTEAAVRLASKVVSDELAQRIKAAFGSEVIFVAPEAHGQKGKNKIPAALSGTLARKLGATAGYLEQLNIVRHTNASAMSRLLRRPIFGGDVAAGARYVLVDDVTTLGGTLAEMAAHIAEGGGKVVGTFVVGNASRGAGLVATNAQIRDIKSRFGDVPKKQLKISPEGLTEAEARYLLRFKNADSLRAKIAKEADSRGSQSSGSVAEGRQAYLEGGATSTNILAQEGVSPSGGVRTGPLPLYSAVMRAAEALPDRRMRVAEAMGRIQKGRGVKNPGRIKQELESLGLREAFADQKFVTPQEVQEYIRLNRYMIEQIDLETVKSRFQRMNKDELINAIKPDGLLYITFNNINPSFESTEDGRLIASVVIGDKRYVAKEASSTGKLDGELSIYEGEKKETIPLIEKDIIAQSEGSFSFSYYEGIQRRRVLIRMAIADHAIKNNFSGVKEHLPKEDLQDHLGGGGGKYSRMAPGDYDLDELAPRHGEIRIVITDPKGNKPGTTSHSEEPGEIINILYSKRKSSAGAKTLFLRQLQSDEAQDLAAEKRHARENLEPDEFMDDHEFNVFPLMGKTSQWTNAGIRTLAVKAARENYTAMAIPLREAHEAIQGNLDAFGHYAENVRAALEGLGRFVGAEVKQGTIEAETGTYPVLTLKLSPAARRKILAEGLPLFQGKRGAFDVDRRSITMFDARDASTFMHESAHFYLDLLSDLNKSGDASPLVRQQLADIYEWYGKGEVEIYDANGVVTPEGVELHETFAETFETYLQEGKAPTARLRKAFQTMKRWLTRIYQALDTRKRARIDDNIRRVMDRMLATEAEINAASDLAIADADKMVKEMWDKGLLTERQYKSAQKKMGAAREAAKEDVLADLIQSEMRRMSRERDEQRREIRREVIREFDASPLGRAYNSLSYGKTGVRPEGGNQLFQDDEAQAQRWYRSALYDAVEAQQMRSAPAKQWLATLQKAPGIKAEEIKWTELEEFLNLAGAEGNVTRDAVLEHLRNRAVDLDEVVSEKRIIRKTEMLSEDEVYELQDELPSGKDGLLPDDFELNQRDGEINPQTGEITWRVDNDYMNRFIIRYDPEKKLYNYTGSFGGARASEEDFVSLDIAIEAVKQQSAKYDALETRPFNDHQIVSDNNVRGAPRNKDRKFRFLQNATRMDVPTSHYREIKLTLPGMRSSFVKAIHFEERNIVAFWRSTVRQIDGKSVLFGDEAQSDWHQMGRMQGYVDDSKIEKARKSYDETIEKAASLTGLSKERADQFVTDMANGAMSIELHFREAVRGNPQENIQEALSLLKGAAEKFREVHVVPDAPFKGDAWEMLLAKRLVSLAVAEGHDAVAWPDSKVLVERYHEDSAQLYRNIYDKRMPKHFKKLLGVKAEHVDMGGERGGYWIAPITQQARDAANRGLPLFQDEQGVSDEGGPEVPKLRLNLDAVRDDYGPEFVAALPSSVRRRSSTRRDADDFVALIGEAKSTLRRKPPKSLTEWLRSRGKHGSDGLSDETGAVLAAIEKRSAAPSLIREDGMSLQDASLAATEMGYFSDVPTSQEMLDAIRLDVTGERRVYREQDRGTIDRIEEAAQWRDFFAERGIDIFETEGDGLRDALQAMLPEIDGSFVSADEAADILGFRGGEDLLRALASVGSRKALVDAETERRVSAAFADSLDEGTLREKAREEAERQIGDVSSEIELEALSRAVGRSVTMKLARSQAMDILSRMSVAEIQKVHRWKDAERRFGDRALEAMRRGNASEALLAKQRQLINRAIYDEALKADEQIAKTLAHFKRFETSEGRRAQIDPDYLSKIDGLLEGLELRVSKMGPGEQETRATAASIVAALIADGVEEDRIAPELMMLAEQAQKASWKALTLDEVEYLKASVDNLAHLGRRKNDLLHERKRAEFDATVTEIVDRLDSKESIGDHSQDLGEPTASGAMTKTMRRLHASLAKFEHLFERLDGQANGPVWTALFRPFAEASDKETAMLRDAADRVKELYAPYSAKERHRLFNARVSTPEIEVGKTDLKRVQILAIALNWGNKENRLAITEGYGWEPARVQAMLERVLTEKDWDFVEGAWEIIGSFRDEAFALHKDVTGVEPKAVKADSFTLRNGRKISGGYYPLKYDGNLPRADSVRQARLDEANAVSDMGRSFTRPMTKTGHLKERVGSGGKPVKLGLEVMDEHVLNVAHDIAYRRAVLDAHKIVRDARFVEAFQRRAGDAQYRQLPRWISAIANEMREEINPFSRFLGQARQNFAVAIMGFKLATAIQQVTGLLATPTKIGTAATARGVIKSGSNPWAAWKFATDRSEFLRDRFAAGRDRDQRDIAKRLRDKSPLGTLQRHSFVLMTALDALISVPSWIGAYDKAMSGKVSGIDKANEADAIAYADSIIRQTQTGPRAQDLPEIMRSDELSKLVTVLYSYFSNLYNLTSQQLIATRQGEMHPLAFAANMLVYYGWIPLLSGLLAGRMPGEDDEEEIGDWASREIILSAFGTIPVVRDAASYAVRPQFGLDVEPASGVLEGAARAITILASGEAADSEAKAKAVVRGLGAAAGLPVDQLWITGEYILDVIEGEEDLSEPDALREALLRDTR